MRNFNFYPITLDHPNVHIMYTCLHNVAYTHAGAVYVRVCRYRRHYQHTKGHWPGEIAPADGLMDTVDKGREGKGREGKGREGKDG